MNFDLTRFIKMALNRETIEGVLFESEFMVAATKIDPSIVINKYASKLTESKPFVAEELKVVAKRLKANQNKFIVYSEYVDNSILLLLKSADQKGFSTSEILKEYAPIRKIAVRNQSRIKSALMVPLVIFIFITLLLNSVAGKLSEAKNAVEFSWLSLTVMDHFLLINFTLFSLLVAGFFYYPRKLPILSKIYEKLDSLLAVSLSQTMYAAGFSSRDIIPMLKNQFGIIEEKGKGDIAELVRLLGDNKLLSVNDMADLELAMEYGQFDNMLLDKKEQKFEEAKQFSEMVGDIVKNFSILIISAPIFQFVMIIMDLVTKSTSMAATSQ